jgi:hypothetical protein
MEYADKKRPLEWDRYAKEGFKVNEDGVFKGGKANALTDDFLWGIGRELSRLNFTLNEMLGRMQEMDLAERVKLHREADEIKEKQELLKEVERLTEQVRGMNRK